MLICGSLSKFKFSRAVVQAVTQFLEGSVAGKFFEVSIDTMRPRQEILSAIDASGAKASLQMVECSCPHLPDSPCLCYCLDGTNVKYFINLSCNIYINYR